MNQNSGRLVSLDALRGFDLIWILGADQVGTQLVRSWNIAPTRWVAGQLDHCAWAGVHFYDLIFPLFVFIAGASIVFAVPRQIERQGRAGAVRHILRRGLILFLLGIVYNGGLSHPWPDVRLLGVLQRISLAYTAAALLFCFGSLRIMAAVFALLLAGYWAVLDFIPIHDYSLDRAAIAAQFGRPDAPRSVVRAAWAAAPGRVTGRFEPGLNVTSQVDFLVVPGRMYDGDWDPEGLLSTFPAIATCLLGVFAGRWLTRADRGGREKVVGLVLSGAAALALGWLWSLEFPVVKKIWTSSFVLVAGGWALIFLAAFYYVIDVRGWRRWAAPLVWIGLNPITLYLATALISFGGVAAHFVGSTQPLLLAATALALLVALAWFLQDRKVFLRV
ncbi:MAG TPA: DUF5009 domain-containing protein [Opitutaceae bacterium]|jgi:predicted acyltransferase